MTRVHNAAIDLIRSELAGEEADIAHRIGIVEKYKAMSPDEFQSRRAISYGYYEETLEKQIAVEEQIYRNRLAFYADCRAVLAVWESHGSEHSA